MRARRIEAWRVTLTLVATPVGLLAQDATISGRVTSQALVPISGAIVTVVSTKASTVTNEAGTYRLVVRGAANGQQDTLRVTRIGYRPQVLPFALRAGAISLDASLAEQAVALEQVVVTGTAGNQERRAQAATIASIDASSLVQVAPINNVQQLLTGRIAGVSVTQTNGSVGSTSVIRIRGISSISLSNEPLVFIDGVRMDNRNLSAAGGSVSTLNSIDPNEIESMEVVKGPAAATLYGADASAGVIQIITKKGRAGSNRFSQSVTGEYGLTKPNWTPPDNYARCGAADIAPTSLSALCRGQPLNTLVHDNPIVREGLLDDGNAKVLGWQGRGGGQNFGYFMSYGYTGETATVPQNAVRRQNARTDFNFVATPKLTVDAGFGLVRDVNEQVNVGDNIYGLLTALIGSPTTVGAGANGWFTPNRTGVAIASIKNRISSTRFTPRFQAQWAPLPWMTHRLVLGGDVSRIGYQNFFPKNSDLWYAGNNNLGLVREDRGGFDTYTADYRADLRRAFLSGGRLKADLSLGAQFIARTLDSVSATGYDIATNSSNVISSATNISAAGTRSAQRFVGFIGQTQLAYNDRLFVQVAARVDQNSAFANSTERFILPKFGLSYVLSDESFWKNNLGFFNTFRARAAYGTTGRSPQPGAALTTFNNAPFVLDNGTSSAGVVPANPGNKELRAERGQEVEAGFDAGLFSDRVGLEFTYFNKATRDLILARPIPPSLGFAANPFINIGRVRNTGIEGALRGSVLQTRNFALDLRTTITTLHNEIESLGGVAPFTTGVSGINAYREGFPLGVFFGPRVKSVDVAAGRAVVSDTNEFIGTPVPKYEGTFGGDLTVFRNLRLTGLFEYKGGHKKYNATIYFREKAFTQEQRYQRRDELPAEERIRLFGPYVNSKGTAVASNLIVEDYIEDASFMRFRELSVTYSVPTKYARLIKGSSMTISAGGRNLGLWTDYSKPWDPESITYVPASGVFFNADFLTMPQSRRFYTRVNIGF